ncbi:MAG TPA: DUF4355 domain-containing protein [Nocardioidaceae bacterium]|nr:DUF4355 domain-containing protein [Nocardioidaceae bacterium]
MPEEGQGQQPAEGQQGQQQSAGQQQGQEAQQGQQKYEAPASQADFDRIVGERLARERAKFSDYDDLKQKASEFDKLAEAQKSEAQKAIERAEKAERTAAEHQTSLLRYQVAASKGVPADLVDFLTGADQSAMEQAADRLLAHVQKPNGVPSFDGGSHTVVQGGDMNQAIRRAAGRA